MTSTVLPVDGSLLRIAGSRPALAAVASNEPLWAGASSPTQSVAWLDAAAASFPDETLHVVTLHEGELVAAAPLVMSDGAFETASVRWIYEPVDLLWRDEDALAALADTLAHHRLPLILRRVPQGSASVRALRKAYGRGGFALERPAGATPIVELDERWQEPESRFSSRRRSDLRRAKRLAGQLGSVDVELLFPTPATVESAFQEALAVEERSWKGSAGSALRHDSLRLPFYDRYVRSAAEAGELMVAFLRIDGRAVAMQLNVVHGESLWLLKIGYDEAYRRCSPGQLLMMEVIRHAAGRGLQRVEFLGFSAPWTRIWTEVERPMSTVRFFPLRPGSIVPAARHAVGQLARKRSRESV